MRARLRSLWGALFGRGVFERAMDEEMRFHLEARAADLVRQGWTQAEAARRARLEFGAPERYKDECREARGLRFFDELRADLRYAWRSWKGSPGASVVSVVILALAIAANVALFTFIDAYALRPLPIPAADRYVDVLATGERGERARLWTRVEMRALEQATAAAFEGLYGSTFFELPMFAPGRRVVRGQTVSSSYFPLLGARLARGRAFTPENDGVTGEEAVAVLSDAGWKRLLPAETDPLGRRLRLGNGWFTVIGVTAPEFRGVEAITPELWIPLAAHAALTERPGRTPRYDLAGVLRRGVTPEVAVAMGSGVVSGFERSARGDQRQLVVEHRPSLLHADERGELAPVGGLVLAAFGLVLLIACANLASLHLARASARHREIATRLALGASRPRLVRQLLTESLLLAAIGGALGCAAALAAAAGIQKGLFSVVIEAGLTLAPIEVHGRVLAFAVLLVVVAGVAFGLLPALEATSPELVAGMRRDGLALGGRIRSQRLGALLVTGQVAASLVLLVLASLLLRNAIAASRADPGYQVGRLVDWGLPHPTASALERVRRDPRVAAASAVGHTPLSGSMPRHAMLADGTSRGLRYNHVDEAYFDTLGVPLVAGRAFRREEAAQGAAVVVVSAATARVLWPGRSALGRVLEVVEPGGPAMGRYQVIGVAPDLVSGLLVAGRDPTAVYFPAGAGSPRAPQVLLRAREEIARVVEGVRGLCEELDRAAPCEPRTLREVSAIQRFPFVAASVVASALGALAVVLTVIGLYGIVAFAVVQRAREVGVRLALGATRFDVLRLFVGRAVVSVLLGLALGGPVCVLLAQGAARVFGLLEAFDPVTLAGVPVLLVLVVLMAAVIPARRATGLDPATSLRVD